ncbi:C69 family dipeptidase [Bacteroides sp.]|uniref:dipeptidase n=1 Tax=Bacteroides sp. TaxID=29523 RepID=UPI002FC8DEDF
MKRITTLVLFLVGISLTSQAQTPYQEMPVLHPESCTSIMVGKKASTDGSVITSHTCDSYYRTWLNIEPGRTYDKDTTLNIYQDRLHTEFTDDATGLKFKGTIPQAHTTFSFLDTAYPCLNEKQLGMGETTISGRKELVNPKGMFMIEELAKVALQRCTTARQAITLMGELIEKYGYSDWGECLTIADPQEVWIFEVFGEGKENIGGVWAAVRIPDEEVSVSANISRIGILNLKDQNNYMASKNVFDVARKLGFWDGKEPFKFWKAYSGGNYFGEKKSFSIREFFVLNTLAPSLKLSYEAEELPLSVKPEKLVSAADISKLLRQTYEGTPWDVTRNLKVPVKQKGSEKTDTIVSPVANPWMTRDMMALLNSLRKDAVPNNRNIAVPQCSYSTVIQLRSWLPDAIGGIAWFAFDNPGQSPRIPIFCGVNELPASFGICGQHRYREDAAVWPYRRANKLATVKWGTARKALEKHLSYFDEKAARELPFVEKQYAEIQKKQGAEVAQAFLNGYSADYAGATQLRWQEMGDQFWHDFQKGF